MELFATHRERLAFNLDVTETVRRYESDVMEKRQSSGGFSSWTSQKTAGRLIKTAAKRPASFFEKTKTGAVEVPAGIFPP